MCTETSVLYVRLTVKHCDEIIMLLVLSAFWQVYSSVLAPEVPEALAASRAKSGGTLAAFVLRERERNFTGFGQY